MFFSQARVLRFSRTAAAVALLGVAGVASAPAVMAAGLFTGLAGDWKGEGSISWSTGETEHITCKATYDVDTGGNKLTQNLTCATDSVRLIVKSQINYNSDAGSITGSWQETTYGINGNVSGSANAVKIQALVISNDKRFNARVTVATNGSDQTVKITPQNLEVTDVSVKLKRSS